VREAQVRYSKDTSPLEVGGCRTARLYWCGSWGTDEGIPCGCPHFFDEYVCPRCRKRPSLKAAPTAGAQLAPVVSRGLVRADRSRRRS